MQVPWHLANFDCLAPSNQSKNAWTRRRSWPALRRIVAPSPYVLFACFSPQACPGCTIVCGANFLAERWDRDDTSKLPHAHDALRRQEHAAGDGQGGRQGFSPLATRVTWIGTSIWTGTLSRQQYASSGQYRRTHGHPHGRGVGRSTIRVLPPARSTGLARRTFLMSTCRVKRRWTGLSSSRDPVPRRRLVATGWRLSVPTTSWSHDAHDRTECTFVGHFVPVSKFNEGGRFFDETSRNILTRRSRPWVPGGEGVPFEVNCGAFARGIRTSQLSASRAPQRTARMGGQIPAVNSDAHSSGCALRRAGLMARALRRHADSRARSSSGMTRAASRDARGAAGEGAQ